MPHSAWPLTSPRSFTRCSNRKRCATRQHHQCMAVLQVGLLVVVSTCIPGVAIASDALSATSFPAVLVEYLQLYLPLDTSFTDDSALLRGQVDAGVADMHGVVTSGNVSSSSSLSINGDVSLSRSGVSGGSACFDGFSFIEVASSRLSPLAALSLPRLTIGGWVLVRASYFHGRQRRYLLYCN
jgi:hypothetical protein